MSHSWSSTTGVLLHSSQGWGLKSGEQLMTCQKLGNCNSWSITRVLNVGQQKILTAGIRRPSREMFIFGSIVAPWISQNYYIFSSYCSSFSTEKNWLLLHFGENKLLSYGIMLLSKTSDSIQNPNYNAEIWMSQQVSLCYMKSVLSSSHKLKIWTVRIKSK